MEIRIRIDEDKLRNEIDRLTSGTLITHRISGQIVDRANGVTRWVTFTPNTQQEAMTLVLRAYGH